MSNRLIFMSLLAATYYPKCIQLTKMHLTYGW
jgi:hypothetical protein